LKLSGLYRLRNSAPGFAVCLFAGPEGGTFIQHVGANGLVDCYSSVNVEGSFVFAPPMRSDGQPWTTQVGDAMLYAFHRPDGSFAIGTHLEVMAAVREELVNLRALPFLWEEAASFVGDEEQLRRARVETAKLLRHPTWGGQKKGEFSAGESTPKRRSSADAIRLDERLHVEEPLLEHLGKLNWSVVQLEMHHQTPADTGRKDFSQVVLEQRLADAILTLNDWMEPDQVEEVVRRLCDFQSPSLIENNKQVLRWIT
jgi:hypothetical protein